MNPKPTVCPQCETFVRFDWETNCGKCGLAWAALRRPEPAGVSLAPPVSKKPGAAVVVVAIGAVLLLIGGGTAVTFVAIGKSRAVEIEAARSYNDSVKTAAPAAKPSGRASSSTPGIGAPAAETPTTAAAAAASATSGGESKTVTTSKAPDGSTNYKIEIKTTLATSAPTTAPAPGARTTIPTCGGSVKFDGAPAPMDGEPMNVNGQTYNVAGLAVETQAVVCLSGGSATTYDSYLKSMKAGNTNDFGAITKAPTTGTTNGVPYVEFESMFLVPMTVRGMVVGNSYVLLYNFNNNAAGPAFFNSFQK